MVFLLLAVSCDLWKLCNSRVHEEQWALAKWRHQRVKVDRNEIEVISATALETKLSSHGLDWAHCCGDWRRHVLSFCFFFHLAWNCKVNVNSSYTNVNFVVTSWSSISGNWFGKKHSCWWIWFDLHWISQSRFRDESKQCSLRHLMRSESEIVSELSKDW